MSRRPVPVILCVLYLLCSGAAGIFAAPSVAVSAVLGTPTTGNLERILDAAPSSAGSPAPGVYRWDLFPDVLVVDSATFAVQDRLFSRLAYYLEKRGYRGRLLTNAQLAGRHGWNAHDYGAAGLADFFTAASSTSFPLNPEEVALRTLSIQQGIIQPSRTGYAAGRGAILGISLSSSRVERELLLTHEAFHGVFFSSAEYRRFCQELWDSLSPQLKQFYEDFLDSLGYDVGAPTLVVNEFQAYLMQQPLSYAAGYFQRFIAVQDGRGATVAPWQLLQNAQSLDAFLRGRFGFGAGGPLLASLGTER